MRPRQFHGCVNIIDKPGSYSLPHSQTTIWYSLLLLGYQPVQHITVQNNTRLDPAQDQMMQLRNMESVRWVRLLPA